MKDSDSEERGFEGELVAGVDIGGTNTAVGIVGEEGRLLSSATFPTRDHGSAGDFVRHLTATIRQMVDGLASPARLRGIGMAAPAANWRTGTVENPANLRWGNVNLVAMVRDEFKLPVSITNDANAALLGEMSYGLGRGLSNVILITLGTGLGAGIAVDGALVQGENGAAGEFGHMTMERDGRQCGCGRRGCAETYVSATGLRRTVFALLAEQLDESELRRVSYSALTSENVSAFAAGGDALAREALAVTGRYLGRLMANLAAAFDPEAIILGGGLVYAGDLLVEPARRAFMESALKRYTTSVRILVSPSNEGQMAILGASRYAWQSGVPAEAS
ncbi:MAG TPA: ROK family protein [Bacteroidota bacterium]|nr:ROK family protein [Bacteroidota bacterium]